MNTTQGFSLVESLVIVSMISILTAMSLTAVPALRSHQELVADTETNRALLLDAKQRTLNQVRPEDCLQQYEPEHPNRAACSDVGVAIQFGEIIEYANTVNSGQFKYDPGDAGDHVITRSNPSSRIETGSATSLLFVGIPPSAVLYKDGTDLLEEDDTATITLVASNGTKRTITVYSFGTIDVE